MTQGGFLLDIFMAKSLLDKRLSNEVKTDSTPKKIPKQKKNKETNLLSSRLSSDNSVSSQTEKHVQKKVHKEDKDTSYTPVNNIKPVLGKSKKTQGVSPELIELETSSIQSDFMQQEFISSTIPTEKSKTSLFNGVFKKKQEDIKSEQIADMSMDDILDRELDLKEAKTVSKYKINKTMSLFKRVFIVIGCIYVSILIYGAVVTEYTYDDTGNAVPLAMSYSDLQRLNEYEALIEQYYAMQDLYGKMLDIDYKYYLNPNDSIALSAEYEGLLEDVSKVSIKTESISVSTAYTQIRSMMLTWIKSDIAVYLQNMSAAIAQNNSEKAENAAQDRTRLQSNYAIISNNLIALGKQIKGMDINKLVEWTPEKHNEKLIEEGE